MALRRRPVDVSPEEVAASMPDELIPDRTCLCACCRPELDSQDREALEAEWAELDRQRWAWLAERGVTPVEYLLRRLPRVRAR